MAEALPFGPDGDYTGDAASMLGEEESASPGGGDLQPNTDSE